MSRLALLSALPLLLALALAALIAAGLLPRPVLYLRADLGTAALLAGLAISGCAAAALAAQHLAAAAAQRAQARADNHHRRFLQRLDHELKNPLMAVRAGLANLAAETPAATTTVSSVETQVLRLAGLAADLRKLADLETRPLEREPVDLAGLLGELIELGREHPAAHDRQLTLSLPRAPWPLPQVAGDRDLLFLALYNLLDNAIKFTHPGDTIELRAFEDNSTVVVEVADTGPGVPLEDQPHVWEELYRGSSARGTPGSGLGMPLVRAIIGRHAGEATLRSRPGQGTVVRVRLPAR